MLGIFYEARVLVFNVVQVYSLAATWRYHFDWEEDAIAFQSEMKVTAFNISVMYGILLIRIRIRSIQYDGIHAVRVLHHCVPGFEAILSEMMNPNPACRPTAQQSLAKFISLQLETPDSIRFAPEKGYCDLPKL